MSNGRRGRAFCPGCKRQSRDPKYPYCLNCTKKLKGRPAPKNFGECAYGRCHKPVAKNVFGMGVFRYCELHQNQYERGIIKGSGPMGTR